MCHHFQDEFFSLHKVSPLTEESKYTSIRKRVWFQAFDDHLIKQVECIVKLPKLAVGMNEGAVGDNIGHGFHLEKELMGILELS